MLPQAVSDHYQAQQRLIVGTLGLTRREWDAMSLADLDGSWAKVAPRVNLLTASAQLGSARNGAGYVAATLAEFGEDLTPAGLVDPRAFAGIASDGRPLGSLLDGALYRAKGMNSLEAGGKWLDMAVHTQIADAGRSAASVAIASYDDVGWVRMVNPPCCGPCAVLSGKKYRYNQGFQRHPRCDCVHIPSTLANPADNMGVNPSLDQITDLTAAEREALAEGADLSQVINARRRRSRDKMSTLEGTARRGQRRLTPDGIFAQAKDRDEALALLRQHGYLSEYGRVVPAARAATSRLDPKWLVGRDAKVVKVKGIDAAKAKVSRFRKEIADREARIAAIDAKIAARKVELREVYGVPARSVNKTIKNEITYKRWIEERDWLTGNMPAYRQGLDDAIEELRRLAARQNLPDFDPGNPLKFYGDRFTFHDDSDTSVWFARDWETFDEDLHRLMRDHFAEVDGGGVYVGGGRDMTDVDDLSRLKGISPRGHQDRTWDDVGGLYSRTPRVCGCSRHAWRSDTHSTALHEAGHVIDDALGQIGQGVPVSSTDAWKSAYESGPMKEWLNPYYTAEGNPTGYLSESFAEALAAYQKGSHTGLAGDSLAEFVGQAMGINPSSSYNGESAAILTGRPLVRAIEEALKLARR